jgi:TonB family protein
MTGAADAIIRSSIVLLIAFAWCAAWRRRSAAVRHLVLGAGLFSAAAVVPLTLVLPVWNVSHPRVVMAWSVASFAVPETAAETSGIQPAPEPRDQPAGSVLAWLWALGSVIGITLLAVGLARLARVTSRAERISDAGWLLACERLSAACGLRTPPALLRTGAPHLIATWGLFRPCVLLPRDAERWDQTRMDVVLAHELAHVRRRDWLVQIAAQCVRAVFWFNPLFGIACRLVRRESEHACDDAVLGTGVDAEQYAAQLVDIARTSRSSASVLASALPIARPSSLEGRIAAMLNTTRDRGRPTARAIVTTIVGLLGIAIAVSAAVSSTQTGPLPLAGQVYDASGGVMPEVTLTLEGEESVTAHATTDSSGRFEFPSIAPGRYVLSAAVPGFRPLRHELVLKDARDWERAITLQVGAVQESIVVSDRRRPGTAPASAAATGAPLRVGGNVRAPRKTVDVRPVYPDVMRDAGLEGVVPIEAVIGTNGSVTAVRVVSAQVHPDFARAAVDAVRQWRFTPTLLNGTAVEIVMTVKVEFRLTEE